MNPNPPQGDTWYCWAASVVCAAHDLGYDVVRYRSEAGIDELVREYGQRVGLPAGMNHVLALAAHLGVRAEERRGLDAASARALVAGGERLIVDWNPSAVRASWYRG